MLLNCNLDGDNSAPVASGWGNLTRTGTFTSKMVYSDGWEVGVLLAGDSVGAVGLEP